MVPPGFPDYLSRRRILDVGTHRIAGRAWSGWAPIASVQVSTDGGMGWRAAELGDPSSPFAWSPWTFEWEASEPGAYELCCRATDAAGNEQPLSPLWNLGGYSNNEVQRVPVTVTG